MTSPPWLTGPLATFFQTWSGLTDAVDLPGLDRLDRCHAEGQRLLQGVSIVDVERDHDAAVRFRYRTCAPGTEKAFGRDMTGRLVDEVEPADLRDLLLTLYRPVARDRRPAFQRLARQKLGDTWYGSRAVAVPFADGTGAVSAILVARETVMADDAFTPWQDAF